MSKKKEIIVVLSHLDWDFPCDFINNTTLQLSEKGRVVVFNPFYFPTIKNLIFDQEKRKKWLAPFKEKKIIYFPSIAIIPFQRFKLINRFNTLINLFLFNFFYFLKFGFKKPIFWGFTYQLAELIKYFHWGKFLVYDRVDHHSSLDPTANKIMKKNDLMLIKIADVVFTNSPYALRYIKKYNKNSFLVPCGCNIDLFLKGKPEREEIEEIKKPIIGLMGSLDHRLDFKILYPLIKKKKEWSFVFIGSIFNEDLKQFVVVNLRYWTEKLKKLPNVYFLGRVPKNQMLVNIINIFDVCLIPYNISLNFVKGCNPMKLYEYLALGKPVISTPIEAVKMYFPVVQIANDAISFEKSIENFLKLDNNKNQKEIEKRRKIAINNSWEEKVNRMWKIIEFNIL